jgi:hypothetical protein
MPTARSNERATVPEERFLHPPAMRIERLCELTGDKEWKS